jgi:hypothetical protein
MLVKIFKLELGDKKSERNELKTSKTNDAVRRLRPGLRNGLSALNSFFGSNTSIAKKFQIGEEETNIPRKIAFANPA